MVDPLQPFSAATRAWFTDNFSAPTPAQAGAWAAITERRHTLVVAPTGSGKTLSAFLWALDRLASTPPPQERSRRCRVLYISPMKALGVDVERNLRAPLVGIRQAAQRLDLPIPEVSVAVRSGDTPQNERQAFRRNPSDVLITTPESLFLMLTSAARESLAGIDTVIVDEVHAVAGSKRGAHLALSLERLDELLERPAQRIGLSATVRPVEEVSRFLAGGRPVTIVQPPSTKAWDLEVEVPVPDLENLPSAPESAGDDDDPTRAASIWPHVEERIVDLIEAHRTTLVFANSRRLAERLTSRLNEISTERRERPAEESEPSPEAAGSSVIEAASGEAGRPAAAPAQLMGQAGSAAAPNPEQVIARAHHGSVSKDARAEIEDALKSGRLPAVVATSSLELGIDMGSVDLVVQVESPPSVASGLQRVGRAGHQVGATSHGVVLPKFRGDLLQSAVVVEQMRAGAIERLQVPANPIDVLAQQIVAMLAMDDWSVGDLEALLRRSAPYASLPRPVLESVLDMLSGRYPSDEFAELRPRIVWDRTTDRLTGRRGAQRLAVTSGGTIPDRGLFGVFLATGEGPGRRVGELDEEMVYESRVGDVFTLGTSTWRIEEITHDRVLVTPAPGQPGRLPFWRGDSPGRPVELGRALGTFVRELAAVDETGARARVTAAGLDTWAADNLLIYLREQRAATGHLPDDRTLVVERFRDELGDWRVVIHSPYGSQVHAPWALGLSARLRERFGVDVQAMHADDGIVLRLLDLEEDDGRRLGDEITALLMLDPDEINDLVTEQLGGSALFASRFRECAARALLLPRRTPGRRQALWQQRQRSSQLLEVASRYPSFPIVLEAVRECVQDVFDVPALVGLMTQVRSREVRVVEVSTPSPSPFARNLLFGYVAQFLYEGDSPLAERRAAALSLDPELLAELLGRTDGTTLRDLLDPRVVVDTQEQLQRLTPERQARDAEDVVDLLRTLGPMDTEQIRRRTREADRDAVPAWLDGLVRGREVIPVRIAGLEQFAAVLDAGRLRDALGVSLPAGLPAAFTEPVADPLTELIARYARTHGPFTAAAAARQFGLGTAVAQSALETLVRSGRVVTGALRPVDAGGDESTPDFADAEVLRLLRRRSLAALRAEVEPVPADDLVRFLPQWQHVGTGGRGLDALMRAVEQLAGQPLPASALESLILPARVIDYRPSMLDELTASGEVVWSGCGAAGGDDGWIALHPADMAPWTLRDPDESVLTEAHRAMLAALDEGGAWFLDTLVQRAGLTTGTESARVLWDLVWAGYVTGDTIAPLRALLGQGRTAHRAGRTAPQGRYGRPAAALGARRRAAAAASGTTATVAGRWSRLETPEPSLTERALTRAEVLLDRYGVVTRGSVMAENVPDGFAGVYRVLAAAEETGRVRRGYFVEGLGAAQFGTAGAIDRLRAAGRVSAPEPDPWDPTPAAEVAGGLVLAASDPANPFGAALRWPGRDGAQAAEPDSSDPALDADAAGDHDAAGELGAVTAHDQHDDPARGRPGLVEAAEAVEVTGGGHRPSRRAGAMVVLSDGRLVLFVERGGRTVLTFTRDEAALTTAVGALTDLVAQGRLRELTVTTIDGEKALGSQHPLVEALTTGGFHITPKGIRLRSR